MLMNLNEEQQHLIITAAATGQVIDLPREGEDLLIAVLLSLLKDAMVLESEYVLEDVLDAEVIGQE